MDKYELLRQARAFLGQPGRWHQGCLFRDADGRATDKVEDAHSCCAMGALRHIAWKHGATDVVVPASKELYRAAARAGYDSPASLNDRGTLGEVLAMYDQALTV